MKRQREELQWPSNEELVCLICEPAGEVTNANGKITVQHICPHPFCNHRSGRIGRQKGKSHASVVTHLKACIGRHDIEDLYNLYKEIKEDLQDRTKILNQYKADIIARMKPNSGEIVPHGQKRRKHYELLSASEFQDAKSSLDHICMIGVKNRHDAKRRRQFETTHKELLEKEHNLPLDAPPVNPFGPPKHPDNNLFAEDVRLYGKHHTIAFREIPESAVPMQAWPIRETHKKRWTKKGRMFDDKAWNVEHGDTINPLAFATAKLSQKLPSAADQESMNGSNLLVDTTAVGLHESQAPKALLLRCWERAVHASSCTTSTPKLNTESATAAPFSAPPTPSSNLDAKSLYNIVQEQAARSKEESRKKMKSLGMGNYFKNAVRLFKLSCPVCSRQFDDRVEMEGCFFGGTEANGASETGFRGCCWSLIKDKQFSKIQSVLETHVQTQVTGALSCIMKQAERKVPNESARDEMRLFNWYDVLKFVEESLSSSQTFTDVKTEKGVTSALETLEVRTNSTPIFLNPAVLEAVRNRLIDRYADVPY